MLNKFNSIRWKIIVLYLVLMITTLLFSGYFLQQSLKSYFSNWLEKKMIKEMKLITESIKPMVKNNNLDLRGLVNNYGQKLETRITVIDSQGIVLADSKENPDEMDNHLDRLEIQEVLKNDIGMEKRYSETLDVNMKYIALPIKEKDELIGFIRASLTLNKLNKLYKGIWIVLLRSGIIAIAVSILLSLKLTNQITDPIQKITSVAQKIANGSLSQQIIVNTRDEIGQLAKTFNYMIDRLHEKVQEISSEKNKVEAIVSSIGDGVIAVDSNRKVILFNLSSEKIFGVKEKEILNKFVIQATKNYRLDDLIDQTLKEAKMVTEEVEILLPPKRIFRVQVAPIEDKNQVVGAVAVLRDITDVRKLEKMRKEFVSNVSHELKTPLTSIKGYVETLLADHHEYDTYQSFLSIINDEANRLEHLIEDLLDLSKIESNSNTVLNDVVDMVDVINKTISLLERKATKNKIDLKLDLVEELPKVKGNQNQLSRLMINLVDNAIKYTPETGTVKVKAYQKQEKLIVEVKDTGMGIPQKDLSRIFERFYRVDKARSRELGGTGLGLSIVKHIIQQHQGKIDVESEVGVGSKFTFELPIN